MNKYHGYIGFIQNVESEPGIWSDEEVTEREYFGDIVRNTVNQSTSGGVNDNIIINNRISILADPYAHENFAHMKYITFMGSKWRISSAEIQYPRITISMGGVYNGN